MIERPIIKIKLAPGKWRYWFKERDTFKPLSKPINILKSFICNGKAIINVPEEFQNNKNIVFHLEPVI